MAMSRDDKAERIKLYIQIITGTCIILAVLGFTIFSTWIMPKVRSEISVEIRENAYSKTDGKLIEKDIVIIKDDVKEIKKQNDKILDHVLKK